MTGYGRRVLTAMFLLAAALMAPLAGPAPLATAATDITFVGVGHSEPQSQKFKQVTIPEAAEVGDVAVMEFTRASTVPWTGPSQVTGWTQLDSFTASGLNSTLWTKVLTTSDLGNSVRFDTANYVKALLTVSVYSGVDPSVPVSAVHASDTSRTAHVAPSISASDGDWVVSSWVDKSNTTTGWSAPPSMTLRDLALSDVSGRYSGVVADSGGPVAAGTYSGNTATSTPATVALMWTVKLDAGTAATADVVDEINCNFGDDEGSLWIHYRMLDGQPTENTVQYGATAAYGRSATANAPSIRPADRAGVFREARLTGLAGGQVVHYRIGVNGLDHTCATPPVGDFRWDDIGDTGTTLCTPWVSTTHALVAADDPDFVTHGGDISYANVCGVPAVHQYYVDQQVWSTKAAFQPTWGNHEYGQPEQEAPPGTPRDRLANYKSRSTITHAQTLAIDGPNRLSPPGCPAVAGSTTNSCRGEDWGWFRASGVLFISYPEPWTGAMEEWRGKARALLLDARSDPSIDFVVTYGHRPAYTSQPSNGVVLDVRDALDALGDEFGSGVGGKYVLNVAHHVHGEEAFSTQHGVVHLTNGGGGEGQTNLVTANGLIFKSRHPGYLSGDYTAATHELDVRLRCGPRFGTSNADPCTQGSTLYSVSFRAS